MKRMQIGEYIVCPVHDSVFLTGIFEDAHQFGVMIAGTFVGKTISLDVFLFDSGKMTIKRLIEIFTVAFS